VIVILLFLTGQSGSSVVRSSRVARGSAGEPKHRNPGESELNN